MKLELTEAEKELLRFGDFSSKTTSAVAGNAIKSDIEKHDRQSPTNSSLISKRKTRYHTFD